MSVGRYYTENKEHVKAIYTWQRILNVVPPDGNVAVRNEALTRLGTEYVALGKPDEAIKFSEQAGKAGEAEGWRRTAELYAQKNEMDKAADAWRKVFQQKPADVDSRKMLAATLQTSAKVSDRDEALKLYQQILQLAPADELAHVNYGTLLTDFNRYSEAIEEFDRVLLKNPNHVTAHIGRGIALRKRARYKDALDEYLKAIALDPNSKVSVFLTTPG